MEDLIMGLGDKWNDLISSPRDDSPDTLTVAEKVLGGIGKKAGGKRERRVHPEGGHK